MTYTKRVTYSRHAVKRMRERQIRRWQVRVMIARGQDNREFLKNPEPNEQCKIGVFGKKQARVIYLEWQRSIHVVTVMWVW